MVPRGKILVTGATGFVGRNLVTELTGRGEQVTCLIRNMDRAEELQKREVELVKADITDYDAVNSGFEDANTVVHLAAVIESQDKELFESVNVNGTRNCVKAAKKYEVKRFIYVSSLDVKFDSGTYSKSKLAAENIVKKSGLDFVILRPAFIYGKGSDSLQKLVSMVEKHRTIPVIGNGKYKLQPVHVDDVVSIIVQAITSEKSIDGTYYVAGPEEITFDDAVTMIAEILGKKRRKVHMPVFLMKMFVYLNEKLSKNPTITRERLNLLLMDKTCDISNTKNDFDFDPVSFEKGLKLTLKDDSDNSQRDIM
jgi:NADH dehydrogenase